MTGDNDLATLRRRAEEAGLVRTPSDETGWTDREGRCVVFLSDYGDWWVQFWSESTLGGGSGWCTDGDHPTEAAALAAALLWRNAVVLG